MSIDLPDRTALSTLPLEWPWALHDQPSRPLDAYAQVSACAGCTEALCAQVEREPRTPICLKTVHDRVLVDLALFCEALCGDGLDSLLYVRGDRIRECFVPSDMRLRPRDQRWWSLTCHEDDVLLCRPHQRRRRPRRESAVAVAARRGRAAAEAAMAPPAPPRRELPALADVVRVEREQHRGVIEAMEAWAAERGRHVDADVVALLLAAFELGCHIDDPTLLYGTAIYGALWSDVFNWLSFRGATYPDGVPDTMWAYLDFLVQTDRLHPDSDPLDVLRHPLQCYFGLDADGRPLAADSTGPVECTCYVDYVGPSHGELQALDGFDDSACW